MNIEDNDINVISDKQQVKAERRGDKGGFMGSV